MALAVPTDALAGPAPGGLEALSGAAIELLHPAVAGDWKPAAAAERAVARAWHRYRRDDVPPRIAAEIDLAQEARRRHQRWGSSWGGHRGDRRGPVDARPGAAIPAAGRDRPRRFELWARQIVVDGAAGDVGSVNADVATLDWVRDRFAHTVDPADMTRIDAHLEVLRDAVVNVDIQAAVDEAPRLLEVTRAATQTT